MAAPWARPQNAEGLHPALVGRNALRLLRRWIKAASPFPFFSFEADPDGPILAASAICYSYHMKVGEILAKLKVDGWYLAATRGSHRQFKHPVKIGRVTVPGKPSDDLAAGTLNSILKQAQLKD